MNTKYDIHIGVSFDIVRQEEKPKQRITITEEQFDIIKQFAHTFKDKDLNTTYKLNDCEFRVYPYNKLVTNEY